MLTTRIISQKLLEDLYDLKYNLHCHPELSENEYQTRTILIDFLGLHCRNTQIVNMGRWFYAFKMGRLGEKTLAFRADHDAIKNTKGQVFHGCGHDGHSTILAGLVCMMDTIDIDHHLVFIFQHAEENGVGAREIVPHLERLHVDHVYGLHNFPGFQEGVIISRPETMMCASKGMEIVFKGKQAHAGEPDKGCNPIFAISELATALEVLGRFPGFGPMTWHGVHFDSLVMATIASVSLGETDMYGISPGLGKIQLTLRASRFKDLEGLTAAIEFFVEELKVKYQLQSDISFCDEFPDTSNPENEINRLKEVCQKIGKPYKHLEEAIRISEDFGWYLNKYPGCFFGVGSGLNLPPLHNDHFVFPDQIIKEGLEIFLGIIDSHSGWQIFHSLFLDLQMDYS